jgi:hypothetical protein
MQTKEQAMQDDPGLLGQIFTERAAVVAFFGAMGGLTRALALKTGWKEGVRVMLVGTLFASGVGMLAPFLLKPWIGEVTPEILALGGTTGAFAYIMGITSATLIEMLIGDKDKTREDGDAA